MIEDIEGLEPKSQRQSFMQRKGAAQSTIHVKELRATIGKSPGISKRAGCILGKRGRTYVLRVCRRPAPDLRMCIQETRVGQIWAVVVLVCE